MTIYLRQSTASQEVLLPRMVDSTDGNTAETGLTIANTDVKIWKAGATTQADKNSGGATHISSGDYYVVLDATDTNTVGPLVITCHPTGALYTRVECMVLPANVYDAQTGADLLDVAVTEVASGAITAGAIAADAIGASELATDAVTEIVDAVWAKTMTELSAVPGVTGTALAALSWLFELSRNKLTQTSTTSTLFKDDASTTLATSTTADDGTTFSRTEWA